MKRTYAAGQVGGGVIVRGQFRETLVAPGRASAHEASEVFLTVAWIPHPGDRTQAGVWLAPYEDLIHDEPNGLVARPFRQSQSFNDVLTTYSNH